MTNLAAVKVPLPPRAQQLEFAKAADARWAAGKAVFTAASAELAAIDALPAALLRRAFSGAL